ncbi:MAG: twin-arginine translocase TatA/TatE family subunit [Alphaproteobacteria bacterium]|jgi:sec-independent protein translocase protein TatB|nr:twin-arginine translocase TatA/TatE family subunit [Alphaproteobacteria bacterium]MCB1551275.1 twin-arginine translocase TatA/TatE family subunit [Alphaproteobacteria bacterium]MCB9984368.1 twin-arginine translocase TatA/TatE family subunit [Micavibrio sp.]HPQ50258.1 twin-arginine translocase TatA/TatE family subunit [Alphaproteobacteria bacterium]HRK97866.1 twin-arginine translocase TatA/TatE family subunit [Alphaproteobacteria bacterium]
MLDFSWSEFLIVLVVAILAIGPKQIPDVLYTLGRMVRRLQYMRFALTKQFDDFMEQSDLSEMRKISDEVHSAKTSIADEMLDDDIINDEPPKGQGHGNG